MALSLFCTVPSSLFPVPIPETSLLLATLLLLHHVCCHGGLQTMTPQIGREPNICPSVLCFACKLSRQPQCNRSPLALSTGFVALSLYCAALLVRQCPSVSPFLCCPLPLIFRQLLLTVSQFQVCLILPTTLAKGKNNYTQIDK